MGEEDVAEGRVSDGGSIDGFAIEPATPDDRLDVLRVLDAAMLETDAETVAERIDAGDVLVARFDRTGAVVGALVATRPGVGRAATGERSPQTRRTDLHVDAVAVRPARRGRGIGSALVDSTVDRAADDPDIGRVTAAFDASISGLYADLGFTIEADSEGGEDRRRGVRSVDESS